MFSYYDIYNLIIILICLVMSAFFSASETAITSIGTLKAKQLYESGEKKWLCLNLWLKYPNRVLTTILFFNNIVNILSAAVATSWASYYFKDSAIGLVTGILTFLILIIGEIIPKSYAKSHAKTVSLITLRPISLMYKLTYPLIWILSSFADLMLKKLGGSKTPIPMITQKELEYLVNIGQRSGAIEKIKEEMITGVFDFSDTKVREIMTPRTRIQAISSKGSLEDVIKLINLHGHSRIPVYDGSKDNIIGMILAKDIFKHKLKDIKEKKVSLTDIMRETKFFLESKMIIEVFKELKKSQMHLAVIVDEHGGTSGIVTMEDLLEEIVGDIDDEYDAKQPEILDHGNHSFDILGSINIDEFLKYFNIEEKDIKCEIGQDIDTLSGLVTQMNGKLPNIGENFKLGNLNLEIKELGRHRIKKFVINNKAS